jgi:alcohol dehydrogenase class IV
MSNCHFSELRKFVTPEIVFGTGARKLACRYAANFGARKILLLSDPGVMRAGWTSEMTSSLDEAGLPYIVYSAISPNPRVEEVMAGADLFKTEQCNIIIAIGGGSVLDCAKGIGIVYSNKKHILEFEGADRVQVPMPPLICIPTTGGTSADVSQFAIISNRSALNKIAIISKAVVPDLSLIDPETLTTMDNYLTACTGIDAMVHAIEAYVSNASSPLTDIHALEAIRLLLDNLVPSIEHPFDIRLRTSVMLGSLEAGLAFSNASLGAVHAMAHSLGGFLDLPHGECNAILLKHVINFNYEAAEERYLSIGEALGIDMRSIDVGARKHALLRAIDSFITSAGIDRNLSQIGVSHGDIPELARKAIADVCMVTNPRRANIRDIEVIYEEAL